MGFSDIYKKFEEWKDDKALASAVNEIFDVAKTDYSRAMQEQIWFRNILYYLGEQYLEYVKTLKTFRRRILPDYIPTPVANEIKEYVRSIKALILERRFVTTVAPNTNEKEDIKASELGKLLLEYLDNYNEGEFLDEKEKVATGLPLFGTNFLRAFPWMDSDSWVFDKSGNPIVTGEVGSECIIPFQVYVDTLGDRLNKKRWIGIQSLKPKEWVEDTFKIKVSNTDAHTTDYLRQLTRMIGNVSPWKGAVIDTPSYVSEDDSLVLFREVEMKPTMKHPNGRYIIACGDKVLKKYDRMPIKVQDGKWFYSLTDFHMDYIPGSFWSEAGVNGLISPQNTINEIDQALAINRKGVARPKLFTPVGLIPKKVDDVGSLGIGMSVLQYDPLLSGGQKPNIEQGVPLPQQVLEERAIQRTAIQDIGGDPKNILRGQSPGSKASGIMVDTLRETAERGKAPDLERFTRSLNRVQKKRLLLAQEIYTEERILKIAGKGNKWKIVKFKASDLRNNTDVRMELDSGLATTNAGKLNFLIEAAHNGLLGDVSQNPELREEVLRRAGMSGFTQQENPDYRRAENENAKIVSAQSSQDFQGIFIAEPNPKTGVIDADSQVLSPDPLFKYDNHTVHYESHRKVIISDEFSELPQEVQMILINHADAHHQQVVEEEKNQIDPSRDAREFLQLDKLLPVLTPMERGQAIQKYLGLNPDPQPQVVGAVSADKVFEANQKRNEIMLEGAIEKQNQKTQVKQQPTQ